MVAWSLYVYIYIDNGGYNGKTFPFTYSEYDALPLTYDFWDYLFEINNDWGLIVYEQDWLSRSSETIEMTLNNTYFGRQWLLDMGNAAYQHDLSVQYWFVMCKYIISIYYVHILIHVYNIV